MDFTETAVCKFPLYESANVLLKAHYKNILLLNWLPVLKANIYSFVLYTF